MVRPPRYRGQKIATDIGLDGRHAVMYMLGVNDKVVNEGFEIEHEKVGIFTKRTQPATTRNFKVGASDFAPRDVLSVRHSPRSPTTRYSLQDPNSIIVWESVYNAMTIRYQLDWTSGLVIIGDSDEPGIPPGIPTMTQQRMGFTSGGVSRLFAQFTVSIKRKRYLFLQAGDNRFYGGSGAIDLNDQVVNTILNLRLQDIDNPFNQMVYLGTNPVTDANPELFTTEQRIGYQILRWMLRNRTGADNTGPNWLLDETP